MNEEWQPEDEPDPTETVLLKRSESIQKRRSYQYFTADILIYPDVISHGTV
jgi:hypothetical protein